jgi:hypothetical protein
VKPMSTAIAMMMAIWLFFIFQFCDFTVQLDQVQRQTHKNDGDDRYYYINLAVAVHRVIILCPSHKWEAHR